MPASPDRASAVPSAPSAPSSADGDPARLVEAVFTRIGQTRMQGLPYLNPQLAVAAVDFRPWQASWIGALVTPWGINLLQLPAPDAPFAPWRADETVSVDLPGATLSFMPARLDDLGDYRQCPLFSPAQQFADQSSAIATAREVLRLLFEPDAAAEVTQPDAPQPAPVPAPAPIPAVPDPGRRKLFGLRR